MHDDENPYRSPLSEEQLSRDAGSQQADEHAADAESMALLTSCGHLSEAQVYQAILGQNGIDCSFENAGMAGTGVLNALGGVKVFVPAAKLEEAVRLFADGNVLDAAQHDHADVTFACEECGKQITFPGERRGKVETCPKCHEYIDVPE